ncbi:MAG: ATP-binding cassette domain-containing protein [Firmicutes bacterium]|nr:ATP-binding cassette domain-containing protein [Bacillota bacterium]
MNEVIVNVQNVSKSFGGRKVVDKLSLSVASGEVFGLLGHNGAGKSTAIEMPLGIGIDLMKAASMGSDMSGSMANIIILASIAVICSIAAVKTFRWE